MGGKADPTSSHPLRVTTYVGALRKFFSRRVPASDADDLVQDVMVGLLNRTKSSEIENTDAYVFTVARNVLARHQRGGRLAVAPATSDIEVLPDATPSAERRVLDREGLQLVLQTIEGLPARTREVFVLHRFGDMTYGAIARRFGISVSAVEKHIIIALQRLSVAAERVQ